MALRRNLLPAATIVSAFSGGLPATAQTAPQSSSAPTNLWTRSNLLGDVGGLRTILGNYGITLGLTDSENLLGNLTGGVKQGSTMQGVTTATLDVDLGKAVGLQGGAFHASALQIHGQPLSPAYLDDLQTANGNEAENTTRLWELWYDQQFFKNSFDVKIGQQSIDNEFLISTGSSLFVNTAAGWPLLPSSDLYGGGPAYPLSSLGVRLRGTPANNVTVLAGVFDDNPGGGAFEDDAQKLDVSGTRFNLNTGALFIAEVQYATKLRGLPGTYKLGGWYDTGFFPDQLLGTDGLPLSAPDSNGNPIMHKGNYSLYGVVDQTVWQSAADTSRTLNVFARIMGAPTNQNLINFAFNGGVTVTAPLPGRDNDQAGIDFGLGQVSSRAASLDRAAGMPPRGTEELIELTYQAQITPWLQVQPDVQYIVNPGAGIPNPDNPAENLHNELVAGVRTVIAF
ncbi:MAG TPA: carbohydrate porin [Acidocella sp.]|jgi:porin|uniref:carbohydrate porin n=1 Tax=Acidocella sp. TaxID=50710 RepID=UPI002BFAC45B|nr:carbohydrate porin [Acidocella sp.]HVE20954.1 carbohydrate porin [Acidocella sp.]